MPNPKCEICGKTAYPLESLTALEKTYHKLCFKCSVCGTTLNLKNFKGFEGKIYCHTHTPKVKHTQVADSVAIKHATSTPKKEVLKGVHKADARLAPQSTGDFSVNQTNIDQSTENNPQESGITYESYNADQSTENNPQQSDITYESYSADQSTENNPEQSDITYDSYNPDQSTETAEYEEQ
jgi:hypothetical protein